MTKQVVKPNGNIEVILATSEQEPILANLLELYAHDFSEFLDLDLGHDGRYGYRGLSDYWSVPGRHPFLVRVDTKLAGFALVKRDPECSEKESAWDMAEFFVIRRYRRRGIGTHIALDLWRRLPGEWEVRVMQSNLSACHFWARAISMFTGEAIQSVPVERNGRWWDLFQFESKREFVD